MEKQLTNVFYTGYPAECLLGYEAFSHWSVSGERLNYISVKRFFFCMTDLLAPVLRLSHALKSVGF